MPTCSNPASWHPTLHAKQDHHHPPLSWRTVILAADPNADQSWWTVMPLCGLCHQEYHTLLNAFVHAGGFPPWTTLRTYSPFLRNLVEVAWIKRPNDKPPYTVV